MIVYHELSTIVTDRHQYLHVSVVLLTWVRPGGSYPEVAVILIGVQNEYTEKMLLRWPQSALFSALYSVTSIFICWNLVQITFFLLTKQNKSHHLNSVSPCVAVSFISYTYLTSCNSILTSQPSFKSYSTLPACV